jgi:hypothetical protein
MDDPLNIWLEQQSLRQEGEMDCGLCVFGKLANLTRKEILDDMPDAANGKTVEEWETYLSKKLRPRKLKSVRYQVGEVYPLPCAHLVSAGRPHWISGGERGHPRPQPCCPTHAAQAVAVGALRHQGFNNRSRPRGRIIL